MSKTFTAEQIAEIKRLETASGAAPYNNPARPYSGVYTYVLHLISTNGDPAQGPAAGVDAGIWNWFNGARLINKGEGVFSTFIREYTAEQNRIRTGEGVSQELMNAASDEIGRRVVADIIDLGGLISLQTIGINDANGMTDVLEKITLAGWSGNLLFPMLGRPEFFLENITDNPKDSYNFFALIRSANFALTQTLGNSWGDIFDGLKTVLNLAYGDTSTLQLDVLQTVVINARDFFHDLYGESLVSPLFSGGLAGSVGLTYANSFLFSNVVLGKSDDRSDVLHATDGDDLIHGGGGNDTIFASDASLTSNPFFDSDLIDGGVGKDTVSYLNTDAVDFYFYKKESSADFIAEADKSWTLGFDSIYNVEKIIGSSKNDGFYGDASHLKPGFVLDGGKGNDELVVKGGTGITTIGGEGRDWIWNTSKGGIIYTDTENGLDASGNPVRDGWANSDNIWFSPGVTVKGAGGYDQLKFYGFGLTGGAEGIPMLISGLGGFLGFGLNEAAAVSSRDTTVEHPLEGRMFTDNFLFSMAYTFHMNKFGKLDMHVSNGFTGLMDAFLNGESAASRAINSLKGQMKIENFTPVASFWGGSIVGPDGVQQLGLADQAAGTFGMKFLAANSYLAAIASLSRWDKETAANDNSRAKNKEVAA